MIFLVLAILGVAGALIHLGVSKQPRTRSRVFEIFLTWAMVALGLTGLMAAISHIFFGPQTARLIGWPAGNPFQFEVGLADLSLGVLGLVSVWRRGGDFWLATIIFATIFYWGDAVGHIDQIVRFQNYAPGNAGAALYSDIIFPIVLIGLYTGYRLTRRREKMRAEKQVRRAA